MAGQGVVYLSALLLGFGTEQTHPPLSGRTTLSASKLLNLVNRKFTRHIDVLRFYARDLVHDYFVCWHSQRGGRTHKEPAWPYLVSSPPVFDKDPD